MGNFIILLFVVGILLVSYLLFNLLITLLTEGVLIGVELFIKLREKIKLWI